jgi:hypothetical protein
MAFFKQNKNKTKGGFIMKTKKNVRLFSIICMLSVFFFATVAAASLNVKLGEGKSQKTLKTDVNVKAVKNSFVNALVKQIAQKEKMTENDARKLLEATIAHQAIENAVENAIKNVVFDIVASVGQDDEEKLKKAVDAAISDLASEDGKTFSNDFVSKVFTDVAVSDAIVALPRAPATIKQILDGMTESVEIADPDNAGGGPVLGKSAIVAETTTPVVETTTTPVVTETPAEEQAADETTQAVEETQAVVEEDTMTDLIAESEHQIEDDFNFANTASNPQVVEADTREVFAAEPEDSPGTP